VIKKYVMVERQSLRWVLKYYDKWMASAGITKKNGDKKHRKGGKV